MRNILRTRICKSWITSIVGLLLIAAASYTAFKGVSTWGESSVTIILGLALIGVKDPRVLLTKPFTETPNKDVAQGKNITPKP
jgi:hypothetical protein